MANSTVRLNSVLIRNFKNIDKAILHNLKEGRMSMLGLYGQNGSGKSALIDAIELLQLALRREIIPEKFINYINSDAEHSAFSYEFSVVNGKEEYRVFYVFKLEAKRIIQNGNYYAMIADETLTYIYKKPDTTIHPIFAIDNGIITREPQQSVMFSKRLLNSFKNSQDEIDQRNAFLLERLIEYGKNELFVVNTEDTISALPLIIKQEDGGIKNIAISFDKVDFILKKDLTLVKNAINNINIVLSKIIDGLKICIDGFMTNNDTVQIKLMSLRKTKVIPLKYESKGIKKIISILQLLIFVYNNSSVTVAIDDLDSGISEYLLGELLHIISNKGKGQLLFTAYNLRPLEKVYPKFIAFTTTDPQNKYVQMNNFSCNHNNNLRDYYYKNIYYPMDSFGIDLAFYEGGKEL